jgi:hypothetical protein
MGVYDPLRDHLQKQHLSEFEHSFIEIENILGRSLPASAARPQWWANQLDGARPQRDAWRSAGYDAFLVLGRNRVRFVKGSADGRTK